MNVATHAAPTHVDLRKQCQKLRNVAVCLSDDLEPALQCAAVVLGVVELRLRSFNAPHRCVELVANTPRRCDNLRACSFNVSLGRRDRP